jgi:oxygen-dependent protoporphyrinogen oxidase
VPTDFTIVGGGIGGLVVARRLALAGRSVVLLEASDHLGGTVARQVVAGIDLDAGAESFATRGGTVAALAGELGLGDEIVPPAQREAWLRPRSGDPVRLPATSLFGIPGTPMAADVIAVVGRASAMRAELDALIPSLWLPKTISLGALVRRRMGRGVLEKLVAPVVYGVHSVHPDQLPLDRAVPGLRAAIAREGTLAAAVRSLRAGMPEETPIAGIRGGMHRLVTELQADLERLNVTQRFGQRITSVERLSGKVIVAAPGVLSPVVGRKVVVATLVLDAPELDAAPRGSGVLVALGADGVRARALTHSTAKWEWLRQRAGGRHVVRLSYEAEPEQLRESARHDAAALLGVPLPASSVLDFARVEWLRPTPYAAAPEGVTVVGETAAGSGLAAIIAHANTTADTLLAE